MAINADKPQRSYFIILNHRLIRVKQIALFKKKVGWDFKIPLNK